MTQEAKDDSPQLSFDFTKDLKTRYKRRLWVEKVILPGRNGMRMKFLLRVIEGHDRDNVGCRLKCKTIAIEMSTSMRTVARAIKDCVAAGLLNYEPSRHKDNACRFQIEWSGVAQALLDNPATIGLIVIPARSHVTHAPLTSDTCEVSHMTLVEVTPDTCGSSHLTDAPFTSDTCERDSGEPHDIHRARVLKPELNLVLKPSMKPEIPGVLDTPEFRESWSGWIQYREEIGKPLPAVSLEQQLTRLAQLGPDRAVTAIKHSLGNGWVGIFEPTSRVEASTQGPGQKYDPDAVVGDM